MSAPLWFSSCRLDQTATDDAFGHHACWAQIAPEQLAAAEYQIVRRVATPFDVDGWRLAANAVRLVSGQGRSDGKAANSYFVDLYTTLADALESGGAAPPNS